MKIILLYVFNFIFLFMMDATRMGESPYGASALVSGLALMQGFIYMVMLKKIDLNVLIRALAPLGVFIYMLILGLLYQGEIVRVFMWQTVLFAYGLENVALWFYLHKFVKWGANVEAKSSLKTYFLLFMVIPLIALQLDFRNGTWIYYLALLVVVLPNMLFMISKCSKWYVSLIASVVVIGLLILGGFTVQYKLEYFISFPVMWILPLLLPPFVLIIDTKEY